MEALGVPMVPPEGRRGFYGSLVQVGVPLGIAASTGNFLTMSQAMAEADILAWGWRLPFLLSAVLIGVGLFTRLRL